jgi:lipopolysaccharide/colanic/teichoic acid biosynthesis glycosyltransferase
MSLLACALIGRVTALLILVGLLPLNLLIALALRILQGRNVLFFQQRSGIGGEPFSLVKFRTMRDLRDDHGQLLDDAMRVTAIGIFLRKTRLDELPSFWNVVIGELAFIGPRPLLPWTIQTLGDRGVKRGTVRPGLTGWAQINGNTLLTLNEKVALDLWYIEHRSWRTDTAIIAGTLRVMIAGEKRNRQRI